MLSTIWNTLLVNPLFNVLVFFDSLAGSLGLAIILLTLTIRSALLPLMLNSLKSAKKQRDLQPELEKIKKKFRHDKKKQAEMQMELFKEHGINPASGCVTQIPILIVLFALFNVINTLTRATSLSEINSLIYFESLKFTALENIHSNFLWLKLGEPDPLFVLAILAGLFQLIVSKMTQPYTEVGQKAAERTPGKADDFAYNMQSQMLYLMPLMTVLIGVRLPAGVTLYILTTTIFSVFQQYYVSGFGGLTPWLEKIGVKSAPVKVSKPAKKKK
ncbi:MAG: YidC/Oxa1 family membrane protein insertase [Patescibacteria group bacterium]